MGTSVTSSLSHQDHHNLGWGFPGIWGISGERGTWTRGMSTSSQLTLDSAPQIPVPPSTSSPLFILDVKTKVIQAVHRFLVSPMRPFVHYVPMFVFLCILAPFFCSKVFCKISPSFSFLHLKKKSLLSVKKKITVTFWSPLLLDICSIKGYGGIFDEKGMFFMGQFVRFCPK